MVLALWGKRWDTVNANHTSFSSHTVVHAMPCSGDLKRAKDYFDEAEAHAHEAQKNINEGFLALADGDYSSAAKSFETAW